MFCRVGESEKKSPASRFKNIPFSGPLNEPGWEAAASGSFIDALRTALLAFKCELNETKRLFFLGEAVYFPEV